MTENEAKSKWCPMVRFRTVGAIVVNNRNMLADNTVSHLCVGSDCMMWRQHLVSDGSVSTIKYIDNGGYCGLAGCPT